MKEDGTVLMTEIRGGEIVMGADGTPTGYLKGQAGTYVRSFLDNNNLFSVHTEGWSSCPCSDNYYKAAQQLDETLAKAVDAKKYASARVKPRRHCGNRRRIY